MSDLTTNPLPVITKKVTTNSYSTTSSTTTNYSVKTSSLTVKKGGKEKILETNTETNSAVTGDTSGIDVNSEIARLRSQVDTEIERLRKELRLLPLQKSSEDVIKLDVQTLNKFMDPPTPDDRDRLSLNFDVQDYSSESISVKSDGRKIEVHASKKVKQGDDEKSDEFSQTYELPAEVDPSSVVSKVRDGKILSVELPASVLNVLKEA